MEMFEAAIRVLRKHNLLAELAEEMIADHDYGSTAIPEQARDGTPSRRLFGDPISTGTDMLVAKGDQSAAEIRQHQLRVHSQPYKIPGTGETYESWAGKYCDMLRTSADFEAVEEWMDKNQEPLERLRKAKPSVAYDVRTVTQGVFQAIEDAQKRADARRKVNKPTEMDDGTGEGGLGPDSAVIDGRSGEGASQDLPICQKDGETAGTALHS